MYQEPKIHFIKFIGKEKQGELIFNTDGTHYKEKDIIKGMFVRFFTYKSKTILFGFNIFYRKIFPSGFGITTAFFVLNVDFYWQ